MNTPLQPDDPSPRHHSPEKSFEGLMRSHAKQLENIPDEMRIAPLPPSDGEAEETKEYIRKKLGLPISEIPSSKIFLANEILERACILEGRIGEYEGIVAFLFLYRFQKTIKTIYIVPADGLDARMIAKAILWGYLSDLPPQFAQSNIVDSARFFQVKTFNLNRLADSQVLEKYKKDYRSVCCDEIQKERSLRQHADRALGDCKIAYEELEKDKEEVKNKLTAAYDSAFRWNIAALITLACLPIVALIIHVYKI